MRKSTIAALALAALPLAACSDTNAAKADLDEPVIDGKITPKDFTAQSPDQVRVFLNVDDHPTVVRICLEGVAFRTVSAKYATLNTPAVERVPEWDALCPKAVTK